jgi:hypothetical protein
MYIELISQLTYFSIDSKLADWNQVNITRRRIKGAYPWSKHAYKTSGEPKEKTCRPRPLDQKDSICSQFTSCRKERMIYKFEASDTCVWDIMRQCIYVHHDAKHWSGARINHDRAGRHRKEHLRNSGDPNQCHEERAEANLSVSSWAGSGSNGAGGAGPLFFIPI